MSSALPAEAMEQPGHTVYGEAPEHRNVVSGKHGEPSRTFGAFDYHDSDGTPCPRCSGTDYIDVASREGEWMCLPCHNVVESGESQDLIDADRRMRLRAYQSARIADVVRIEASLASPNTTVLRASLEALYATVSQIGKPSKEMLRLWRKAGVDVDADIARIRAAMETYETVGRKLI